jgi:hypothetical protein
LIALQHFEQFFGILPANSYKKVNNILACEVRLYLIERKIIYTDWYNESFDILGFVRQILRQLFHPAHRPSVALYVDNATITLGRVIAYGVLDIVPKTVPLQKAW